MMQDDISSLTNKLAIGTSPSSARLLRGVQATLRKIKKNVDDEQSLLELNSIDFVLSELASRDRRDFHLGHYRLARALLKEGFALLKAKLSSAEAVAIEQSLAAALPEQLDAALGYETIGAKINSVNRHLTALISLVHDTDVVARDYLQRVSAHENAFHVHRARFADTRELQEPDSAVPLDAARLTAYLQQRFPKRIGLRVTKFKQLVGGFQKITVLFEIIDDNGLEDSLVLRSEKNDKFVALDASDIGKEYEIVKFLYESGITVAEPLWLEDNAEKLGQRFFVSRKVAGENYGSAVVMDKPMTDDIVKSFIEAIAKVHMLPATAAMHGLSIGHWLDLPTPQDNWRANITYWRNQLWMKAGNPSPIVERLATWLADNVPQDDIQPCLIHCDYGPHNVLLDQGKVSGIIDWESARIGDPAEDIAWFLQGCGGKVDFKKVIDWYAEITGHRISEYRLRYYDVLGCLKIMTSSVSCEAMYENTEEASIVWLILSYRFASYGTSLVEERIKIAESVRDQ